MAERLLAIAVDDGVGNFTVPPGPPAKWVPGTILQVFEVDFEFLFQAGDKDRFLLIKARGDLINPQFESDVIDRKKSIYVSKFLSGPSMAKYQANVTAHINYVNTQDAEGGHRKAWKKRKSEFDANGHKPDFTKVVVLDIPGMVLDTPAWQHKGTE